MSQEWVNLGSMSDVSQSSGHPHPPLSLFLHFHGHFFHFNNSFVSHHIMTPLHLYIGPKKCWNTCATAIQSLCPLLSMYLKTHNSDAVFIQHSKVSFNLHNWLDINGPYFQQSIYQFVFYYMAWTHQNEWLQVCISTLEMDEAIWKYAYGKQIIFDDTFGVCSSCMLLLLLWEFTRMGKVYH